MPLKEDITDIRVKLNNGSFTNEAAVSQGVVLRLLDSLMWPRYDPDAVMPEYPLRGLKVDYALCYPSRKARILVEVKHGEKIVGAEPQLFEYAFHQGIQMAVLTNGWEWHFYLPAGEGDYSERRVRRLDISNDDLDEIEMYFTRYLRYDAVRSGEAVKAAQKDHRELAEKRQIHEAFPEAWGKLVESEDDLLIDLLAEKVEELCGIKPDPDTTATFLRKGVQPKDKALQSAAPQSKARRSEQPVNPAATVTEKSQEARGYTLDGQFYPQKFAIDVLTEVIDKLAERDPSFLEKLAEDLKHAKGKRQYVASTSEELHPTRPDFASKYARKLRFGWWIDTNLSNPQKESLIQRACKVSDLRYGEDLKIKLD